MLWKYCCSFHFIYGKILAKNMKLMHLLIHLLSEMNPDRSTIDINASSNPSILIMHLLYPHPVHPCWLVAALIQAPDSSSSSLSRHPWLRHRQAKQRHRHRQA
jgi:hypothetical protein